LKLMVGQLEPVSGFFRRHAKLRTGYFSQHFVDQLDLQKTPVEILKEKYPGTFSPIETNVLVIKKEREREEKRREEKRREERKKERKRKKKKKKRVNLLFYQIGKTVEEYRRELGAFGITGQLGIQPTQYVFLHKPVNLAEPTNQQNQHKVPSLEVRKAG